MAKLICKDGAEVEISDETEVSLRKAFGPQSKLDEMKKWLGDFMYKLDPTYICIDSRFENKEGRNYLLISLPNANTGWTFGVWEIARAFVEHFKGSYPVHYSNGNLFTKETFIENVIIKLTV